MKISRDDTLQKILFIVKVLPKSCDHFHCIRDLYTAISRKVVKKNVYATIPKGNVGYDQYTVPDTVLIFCCFPLTIANISPWTLVPFLQISLKNSELKITHNTFRDCHMYLFQQPFSK